MDEDDDVDSVESCDKYSIYQADADENSMTFGDQISVRHHRSSRLSQRKEFDR